MQSKVHYISSHVDWCLFIGVFLVFKLTSISVVLLVATGVNVFVSFISWQKQKTRSGNYFALGISATAIWTCASALDYAAVPIDLKVLFVKIEYLAYNIALVFLGLSVIYYLDLGHWLKTKWTRVAIWTFPTINILLAWTNELHGWLWTGFTPNPAGDNIVIFHHGPAFFWVAGTGYFAIILILLGLWFASQRGGVLARRQARLLFAASILPVIGNLLYLFNIEGLEGIDWSSLLFTVSGVIFINAFYGAHFLDITPIARDTLLSKLRDGWIVLNAEKRIVDINEVAAKILGHGHEHLLGIKLADALPEIKSALAQPCLGELHVELAVGNAEKRYIEFFVSPLFRDSQENLGCLVVLRDITDQKMKELYLRQRTQAIEQSPATVVITDTKGVISYVNPQFTALTGYEAAEAVGKNASIIQSTQTSNAVYKEMWETILAGEVWRGEFLNKKKNGEFYWEWSVIAPVRDDNGEIVNFIAVKQNITERKQAEEALMEANQRLEKQLEEIKKLEANLREQAIRDPLTKLHNRRFLVDMLDREFSLAERRGQPLSMIILDIDHFKSVNDTYGHRAGDECLVRIAELLKDFFREADIVCRFGGEEFLVLLSDSEPEFACQRAEIFRKQAAETGIFFNKEKINLTISVGVASYPAHGAYAEVVIQKADQALYRAKHQGRNQVVLCEEE